MALPASGQISLSTIKNELNGGFSLGGYYFGGSYVRPGVYNGTNIPTSGPIKFSNFYGSAGTVNYHGWYTLTGDQSNDGVGLSVDYYTNALRVSCGYCSGGGGQPNYGNFSGFYDGSQVVITSTNTIFYSSILKSNQGVSSRIQANNFTCYFSDGTTEAVYFPAYTRLAAKLVVSGGVRTLSIYWNPAFAGIGDAGYDYMLGQLNNGFLAHSGYYTYILGYDGYGQPIYNSIAAWAYRITI